MSILSELIERVEKADGEDRDLNGDIAVMMGLYARRPVVAVPPSYTASIDAALTLLPDGYDWIIGDVNGQYGGTPYACVGDTTQHFAATTVLALTAACLKARLAMDATQDTEARHE